MVLKSLQPAYGGYTIARDEKIIFLRGAIPGEVVEVSIEDRKKDYSIARVTEVIEPSEFRVEPRCAVFGLCGGCQLQFISADRQGVIKNEIISDTLKRIGGIEITPGPALSDISWNYRHRAQFKVSRDGEIGLFRESSREIVTFRSCPLMTTKINSLLQKIKENDAVRNLTEIHIAVGDSAIVFLKGKDCGSGLPEVYREMGFAGIVINDDITGAAYTDFDLNGLHYTVSPRTFFQAHWALNRKVVEFIVQQLSPLGGKKVLDLYAGAGNFSLPLALHAEEVTAVEENPGAVDDGVRNRELNSLKNCSFVRMSSEKYKIRKKFDVILLDPPRPGLTSEVTGKILASPADSIIYISCNPATLARDLKKLKDAYEVRSVHQIDFFPQTFHIETIAFLQAR